jgi:hypothetical protein
MYPYQCKCLAGSSPFFRQGTAQNSDLISVQRLIELASIATYSISIVKKPVKENLSSNLHIFIHLDDREGSIEYLENGGEAGAACYDRLSRQRSTGYGPTAVHTAVFLQEPFFVKTYSPDIEPNSRGGLHIFLRGRSR